MIEASGICLSFLNHLLEIHSVVWLGLKTPIFFLNYFSFKLLRLSLSKGYSYLMYSVKMIELCASYCAMGVVNYHKA